MGAGWQQVMFVVPVLWLLPVLLVATSRRGVGLERAVWALVTVLTSWLGFAGFLLSTRKTSH